MAENLAQWWTRLLAESETTVEFWKEMADIERGEVHVLRAKVSGLEADLQETQRQNRGYLSELRDYAEMSKEMQRELVETRAELHKYKCAFEDTAHELKETKSMVAETRTYIEQLRGALGYSVPGDLPCNPEIHNGIAEALHQQLAEARAEVAEAKSCYRTFSEGLVRAEAEVESYKKQCEIEHESLAVARAEVERLRELLRQFQCAEVIRAPYGGEVGNDL